jgi:hypothetical protein
MAVRLHWFLPTNGASRTNPSFGSAIGARDGRGQAGATERKGDLAYMSQVARADLEEADRVGEGLIPVLKSRGLINSPEPAVV